MEQFAGQIAAAFQQFQAAKPAEAERACREVLAADPNQAQALHLLGLIASQSGRAGLAIECLRRAIQLKGEDAELYNNLGMAYAFHDELDQAISCHRRAIELQPDYAAAHSNLGNALKEQGRLPEAAESYRQALRLRPGLVSAHYNLGLALQDQDMQSEAIEHFRKALEIDPTHANAHNAVASSWRLLGKSNEAVSHIHRALQLQPHLAMAHIHLADFLLSKGDFNRGWNEYEWRWKTAIAVKRIFREPQWDGSPLKGKTILVHAEQGFGDTFQFIRYAAILKDLGARVIVQAQRPLIQILQHCLGVDQLIAEGDDPPSFDLHVPLLSIPGILKTSLSTIPAAVPYLFANPGLVSQWRARLETIQGFHIGMSWRGRAGRGEFRRRDIPLDHFTSLTSLPGFQWICLQKDLNATDLQLLIKCRQIIIPRDDLVDTSHGAFMDTAAIMMNLDLIITSDTATAHLAGALGVPVWVILPFIPDWRWLLDRSDCPWYPTMRLFRQRSIGQWAGAFDEIRSALIEQTGSG